MHWGKWVSKVAQSCPTLCDHMDGSLPVSCVHGILQARVLEWVAISFSGGSSRLRDRTRSPALQADALQSEPPGKSLPSEPPGKTERESHPVLLESLLAGRLEWVSFLFFSRASFQPKDRNQVSCIVDGFFTSWATRKPKNTGVGNLFLLQWIFQTRNQTGVSCIAGLRL